MKNLIDGNRAFSSQDIQLMACRKLMANEPLIPVRVVEHEEVFSPLERSRIRGPFGVEVVGWIIKMGSLVKMGWDADGVQYLEY